MRSLILLQDNDYSCGVFALCMLLSWNGIDRDPEEIRRALRPTPEDGTSHAQIEDYLRRTGVHFFSFSGVPALALPVPCLVNYQWQGDGHYSVLVGIDRDLLVLANPGFGGFETPTADDFEARWFSRRYGNKWALRILPARNECCDRLLGGSDDAKVAVLAGRIFVD